MPSVQLGLDLLVAGVDVHRPHIESQPGIYPSSQLGCSGKGAWDDPQPCTQTVPAPQGSSSKVFAGVWGGG